MTLSLIQWGSIHVLRVSSRAIISCTYYTHYYTFVCSVSLGPNIVIGIQMLFCICASSMRLSPGIKAPHVHCDEYRSLSGIFWKSFKFSDEIRSILHIEWKLFLLRSTKSDIFSVWQPTELTTERPGLLGLWILGSR